MIHDVVHIGLDIGSVSAKLAALLPPAVDFKPAHQTEALGEFKLYAAQPLKVQGQPMSAAAQLLADFFDLVPGQKVQLNLTGSQAKLVAMRLNAPCINEFKAIARGGVELVPAAKTILEIGGDVSRYIHIEFDAATKELDIRDYQRNGECAAGTGSFIDQQASRMNYSVEEIGDIMRQATGCANIAGRCSVFAKSDMIHAQQRGYSPGAIFRGLCEAVVRNYKGTVLRGKHLEPTVLFVGGVAANSGVVQAMHTILNLEQDDLIVPELHRVVGAIGCAVLQNGAPLTPKCLEKLATNKFETSPAPSSIKLDTKYVRFENRNPRAEEPIQNRTAIRAYLGLDIGSVSTNLVLVDEQARVIDEIYTNTEGKPVQVVQRELALWSKKWGDKVKVLGVGSTGSGRELIGELVGADAVHDEITAHKTGALTIAETLFNEPVDTIFEIGGQDSKFISIDNGIVVDFAMNEACAAGTGSFLEEQAGKLGISIKNDFSELALNATAPIRLGERCTVFMEKDVTAFIQQGRQLEDICAGLAYAVVHNYLNRVVRGRKIGDFIYFQGGTAYNAAVAAAFATVLKKNIVVPPHNGVIGAIGAALLAKEKLTRDKTGTRFRGFDLSKIEITIRQFTCKGCSNSCDIQECTIEGEKSYWGDKCSHRFRKKRKVQQKAIIPDLFRLYNDMLHEDVPGPDGLGLRIGIPKSMYFYDRFPFWRTYFKHIGAEVVISDDTTTKVAADGREICIAEPCFPIVVGHGHYLNLQKKNVDYVFMPQIINSETDTPEKESWLCPWGQTLALVIRSAIPEGEADHLLKPVLYFRDGVTFIKREMHRVARVLGVSKKQSDRAIEFAYKIQDQFRRRVETAGRAIHQQLAAQNQQAVVIVGRPYNIYDGGINLHVPDKLRDHYGVNVIPLDFLPLAGIDIHDIHENMFWNYGRKILQACTYVGQHQNLHIIYFTNFKCGPDSYIKHFVRDAVGAPYLTLQFDDHSNDAGILTRCEAYLESKGLLRGTPLHERANAKSKIIENKQ
ncbi:hypothetical protein EH223_05865 [candidate division KSB1 bacterium]|nr:hypothetical protein [candidate division KSB1 bacterium]RQW05127.1 MAG: hypothetical protein EH223_05865 [candidate division KSB1 bacterium]